MTCTAPGRCTMTKSMTRSPRRLMTCARESEHGVWACFDTAVDHAREVDSEEWERGIRHRIDQVAHERGPLAAKRVVLAAEGNDADLRTLTSHARHAIGVQPGAVYE